MYGRASTRRWAADRRVPRPRSSVALRGPGRHRRWCRSGCAPSTRRCPAPRSASQLPADRRNAAAARAVRRGGGRRRSARRSPSSSSSATRWPASASIRGTCRGRPARASPGCSTPGSPVAYWYLAVQEPGGRQRPDERARRDLLLSRRSADHAGAGRRPVLLDRVARDRRAGARSRCWPRIASAPFSDVHRAARSVYQFDRTRVWLEPRLTRAPAAPSARRCQRGVARRDQHRGVRARQAAARSTRPICRRRGGRCWISTRRSAARCCRRSCGWPSGPASRWPSSACSAGRGRMGRRRSPRRWRAYVEKLEAYLDAHGAYFHDDSGRSGSAAGDVCRRRSPESATHAFRYTERFARTHARFFQ